MTGPLLKGGETVGRVDQCRYFSEAEFCGMGRNFHQGHSHMRAEIPLRFVPSSGSSALAAKSQFYPRPPLAEQAFPGEDPPAANRAARQTLTASIGWSSSV